MAEQKSVVAVLREYFGQKLGQTLPEFANELKQLSSEEKRELATAAATALGYELKPE